MRLDVSQHARMEQRMKLSPRIIQAMEILQLPMMELQERIDQELERNPVLEMKDTGVDDEAPPAPDETPAERGEQPLVVKEGNGQNEDFTRLDDMTEEYGSDFSPDFSPGEFSPQRRASSDERDPKMEAMANAPAPGQSLAEYLLDQWAFVEVGDDVRAAGELIISYVDADGYLRTPLEEIAAAVQPAIPLTTLRQGLVLVQQLEPVGVAARDLSECLRLQLAAEAAAGLDVSLETELVTHFLRDIEMNHLPQIAKRLGRSVEDIKAAIENLAHLNPRPGSLVGQSSAPGIHPDVAVEVGQDGELIIDMDDGNFPDLRVSRSYRRMAKNRQTESAARQFLQRNIQSAQWLIGAIAQRRHTVRRVTEEVFKVQRDFLDEGAEALKPLPMADVAGKVGVHVATVSRAVAGKYVQTPRGIFPLRMFFSGGKTTSQGEDVAWDAIRVKLKEVIDAEDKSNPLNDDQLAAALSEKGLAIARRTVVKYRKLLDIPPARKRKQF
ncbi:MAG: RNA polymerase factor sigma-54 [Phycisphaerae bacterium]